MATFIVYSSLTFGEVTGINVTTEYLYADVFKEYELIQPTESDVNSENMLVTSVGLFPMHVYAHSLHHCDDITFSIHTLRNGVVYNSTDLNCFADKRWKDNHHRIPDDFMQVIYDLYSSEVFGNDRHVNTVEIDYRLSAKKAKENHFFEAGIGWSNRVVSSNETSQVMGVTKLSNRLNLHTNSSVSFGWKAYIQLHWHLINVKPTFFENLMYQAGISKQKYYKFFDIE